MEGTYAVVDVGSLHNVGGAEIIESTSRARNIVDGREGRFLLQAFDGIDVIDARFLGKRSPGRHISLLSFVLFSHTVTVTILDDKRYCLKCILNCES